MMALIWTHYRQNLLMCDVVLKKKKKKRDFVAGVTREWMSETQKVHFNLSVWPKMIVHEVFANDQGSCDKCSSFYGHPTELVLCFLTVPMMHMWNTANCSQQHPVFGFSHGRSHHQQNNLETSDIWLLFVCLSDLRQNLVVFRCFSFQWALMRSDWTKT